MEKAKNVKDIFKEVYTALSLSSEEVVEKIPDNVFQKIIDFASDSTLMPNFNLEEPLIEQNISEESKNILAVLWQLYMNY